MLLRHGRADARRHPPARAAPPRLRAGRRAGAGHGLPRAPAAGEHVATRASCATASPRAGRSTSCWRRPRSTALPGRSSRARRGRRPTPPIPAPYEPEPVAEWRRAEARAADGAAPWPALDRALGARGARPDRRRAGAHRRDRSTSVDPADHGRAGRRGRRRAARPRPTPPSPPPARRAGRVAAHAGRPSGPAVLFRAAGVDAGAGATSWPPSRCSRRASRGTRPTPTCARRSTSASTTGGRCCGSTAGRPSGAVAAGRGEPAALPGQGRRASSSPRGTSRWPSRRGMVAAALVAGNPVILKPAEQTPADRPGGWSRRWWRPGCRRACSQFLPGVGEEVGARLVEHPDVAVIAFTGSQGRRPGDHRSRPPSTARASAT